MQVGGVGSALDALEDEVADAAGRGEGGVSWGGEVGGGEGVGVPGFEGAGWLQVFEFEKDSAAGGLVRMMGERERGRFTSRRLWIGRLTRSVGFPPMGASGRRLTCLWSNCCGESGAEVGEWEGRGRIRLYET